MGKGVLCHIGVGVGVGVGVGWALLGARLAAGGCGDADGGKVVAHCGPGVTAKLYPHSQCESSIISSEDIEED